MAAQQAVFDIYELLENIIFHLPAIDITRSTLVCKTWSHVITKSRRVHDCRILAPARSEPTSPSPGYEGYEVYHPRFQLEGKLLCNPGVNKLRIEYSTEQRVIGHTFHFGPEEVRRQTLDEFLTFPPIQAVHVEVIHFSQTTYTVYVKDGVKFRDVIESTDVLSQSEYANNVRVERGMMKILILCGFDVMDN